jgi:hypothetical protein
MNKIDDVDFVLADGTSVGEPEELIDLEEEMWQVFTYYTLNGNPLEPIVFIFAVN